MNKQTIILIGGGGHCKACIDVIEQEDKFSIAGIIDVPEKLGERILGYEVIGNDDDIPKLAKGNNFLITVGHLGNPLLRTKLFSLVENNGGKFPIIISPLAYISNHSEILEGTIIMHNAIVNANAKIGLNCIINNNALIEHDVIVEDNVHISTGAIVNGGCIVGHNNLIGSGSVLKHSIEITSNTIIGAGAVVTKDITESGVYVGSPVKRLNDH